MTSKQSLSGNTDHQWGDYMKAAQSGDQSAYHDLLTAITPVLTAYVRARLFDRSMVDDVVQDILLGVHAARHTYMPERPFLPWMFAIAHHKTVDYIRKSTKQAANELWDDGVLDRVAAPGVSDKKELAPDLQAALSQLTPQQQDVIRLLKLQGMSLKDIATAKNMSLSAVKVTAHRGYRALEKILTQNEEFMKEISR